MLPHIYRPAHRTAHVLCHIEFLCMLFHRICPSSSSSSSSGAAINPKSAKAFAKLVDQTVHWLLFNTASGRAPEKPSIVNPSPKIPAADAKLISIAEQHGNDKDNKSGFIASVTVRSCLRSLGSPVAGGTSDDDNADCVIRIPVEHQQTLMQLVVQQAKAVVSQIPLHIPFAVTDAVLCRVVVLLTALDRVTAATSGIMTDSEVEKFRHEVQPALEAVSALINFVHNEMMISSGSSSSNPAVSWFEVACSLFTLFEPFTQRVGSLFDLGLQNSTGGTVFPPYAVELDSSSVAAGGVAVGGGSSSAGAMSASGGASSASSSGIPPHLRRRIAAGTQQQHSRTQQLVVSANRHLPAFGEAMVFSAAAAAAAAAAAGASNSGASSAVNSAGNSPAAGLDGLPPVGSSASPHRRSTTTTTTVQLFGGGNNQQQQQQQQAASSSRRCSASASLNSSGSSFNEQLQSGAAAAVVVTASKTPRPAGEGSTAMAQQQQQIPPRNLDGVSYDAFRILTCLVSAKREQQPSQSQQEAAVNVERFSYEAWKAFMATDWVLLRPIAIASSANSNNTPAVRPEQQQQEQKSAAVVAAPAAAPAAPLAKQSTGDFLLRLMDDSNEA